MPMTAKGLAKLIEECGELTQIAGKKLAYFHTDEHPDGAGSLRERLACEIADVMAACDFIRAHMLGTEINRMVDARREMKFRRFQQWESMPDKNNLGVDFPPPQSGDGNGSHG